MERRKLGYFGDRPPWSVIERPIDPREELDASGRMRWWLKLKFGVNDAMAEKA